MNIGSQDDNDKGITDVDDYDNNDDDDDDMNYSNDRIIPTNVPPSNTNPKSDIQNSRYAIRIQTRCTGQDSHSNI